MPTRTAPNQARGFLTEEAQVEEAALPRANPARKTASIVLSNAFGINEGIAVDTHVKRLAFRLGLTTKTDPNQVEKDLMPLYPKDQWGEINHFLVFFGREVCPARKPKCDICELNDICPKKGVK